MNFLSALLQTLNTPDKFNEDWYAWATRQLSHIALGVTFCGLFAVVGLPLWVSAVLTGMLGMAKEAFDFANLTTWETAYFKTENLVYEGMGIGLAWALVSGNAWSYGLEFFAAVLLLVGGAVSHLLRNYKSVAA